MGGLTCTYRGTCMQRRQPCVDCREGAIRWSTWRGTDPRSGQPPDSHRARRRDQKYQPLASWSRVDTIRVCTGCGPGLRPPRGKRTRGALPQLVLAPAAAAEQTRARCTLGKHSPGAEPASPRRRGRCCARARAGAQPEGSWGLGCNPQLPRVQRRRLERKAFHTRLWSRAFLTLRFPNLSQPRNQCPHPGALVGRANHGGGAPSPARFPGI